MSPDLVRQVGGWLSATDIGWLELRGPGVHVCLRNDGRQVASVAPGHARTTTGHVVPARAASVGRFLHTHPLHDVPLAAPGQRVVRGQTIGLLQVGVLLLPVRAPQDGTIAAHAAAEGDIVGFGAALIDLFPDAPD